MNQCNRGAGNHFRNRNGNPRDELPNMRPADLEKRNMAIEHDEMAADVMLSITDWVLEGAMRCVRLSAGITRSKAGYHTRQHAD